MNYESSTIESDGRLLPGEVVEPKRRRWVIIAIVVAIAIAAGAWFFLARGDDAAAAKTAAAAADKGGQIPTVTVAVPGRQTIRTILSGTGSLAARREMPIGVVGEGGVVTRVLVEPGDLVRAGQVLATVDRSVQTQTAQSLAAGVEVARADARIAQSELDRAAQLVARGFVSKADVERRTATRDAARARVSVAQAQLAEARARNQRLDIRAPAAGLVLSRDVEAGQIVGGGQAVLFRIAMNGQMEMRAQMSENDLSRISVGVPAEVTPVGTNLTVKGEVWQVSPVIDPQTRQGIARIALPFNRALRPGGFASASIVAGAAVAPLLPESAVLSDTQGNYVYVLNGKQEAVRRGVTVGEVSDRGVSIMSGLEGNERVVLTAGGFLTPGQKVNPQLTTLKQ
ncbi:efflux RND transporter periplasmic adaptor subunit [Sphingomonas qomolangmaensis]|uniref:Efflux RND transporter periplasmic adaptor subunit n=1 Tax=Sphingomonas qomolangmaensis TaxID=2918765 RepID=A0ABY5L4E3_9SPHN|nr:efflux RND transporter periplasmic adaptor subunit [Sphingomonas qomolangmaensis]UUL81845.1 efflux RND transporter periplasmic adaptor subunit [Sphingomonas qomolangmaensis]